MKEDPFKEKLKHEIVGIFLITFGIFLFLSLISYDPTDPSFFSYASSKVRNIHNWMGIVGAYASGLLFQGFGFSSFLIPFALGLFAFGYFFRWKWNYPSLKLAGWVIILLTASSLLGLWFKPFRKELLIGGFMGEMISRTLVRYFNLPGATVLLLVILILSIVLGTGISFVAMIQYSGDALNRLIEKISTLQVMRKERSERAKKLVKRKQEREEAGEGPPPVVVVEKPSPPVRKEVISEQKAFEFAASKQAFQLPPLILLEADVEKRQKIDRDSLIMNSRILEKKLLDYGVEGKVVEVRPGPVITVYEFEPAPGVKVSRIVNLADDLALALSALSIRIVAPIPGKAVVGIEVPNAVRETVY
jgi:S-DNA-T family DNA segregation ATPase FtsK/SpoIIIE